MVLFGQARRGALAQASIDLVTRAGVLEGLGLVSGPLKHVRDLPEGRAVTWVGLVCKPPCQSGKDWFCAGFSVKALCRSSAHTFQPSAPLSGKPCFVLYYQLVSTMVHVFAVLHAGTPTTDTDYHPKVCMPLLSSQNSPSLFHVVRMAYNTLMPQKKK